ncbi:MAG: hotdog fold domain-containing protein [Myxococcota bacterium]
MSTEPHDAAKKSKPSKNPLARLIPDLQARGNFIRDAWKRLETVPGGKRIFSHMVGLAAPYTGTIGAVVVELAPGRSKVVMKDRRGLRNHLQSVHAVALVNLAELTGNVALAYSLPDDGRFIVAGLSIDYIKKSRGTITATATCEVPATSDKRELEVPVEMRDASGDIVARATLRSLIGPKRR